MADQITKTAMLSYYEDGRAYELINTGTRIYARLVATEDEPEKVVYCQI